MSAPATLSIEPLLLTPDQAARLLSVSPRTLARLTAADEIRAVRLGRSVRYDRRELERWVSQAQQPRPSTAG
jgi:excisionase family DNA binding protein